MPLTLADHNLDGGDDKIQEAKICCDSVFREGSVSEHFRLSGEEADESEWADCKEALLHIHTRSHVHLSYCRIICSLTWLLLCVNV